MGQGLPGARRWLQSALLCLLALGLLSGCATLARPFSKESGGAAVEPVIEDAPPVTILAVKGPPGRIVDGIAARIDAEARKRGFETSRNPPAERDFRMKGTVTAANQPAGIVVDFVWEVSDAIGAGRHRIAGQEVIRDATAKNPWKAVDEAVMARIGEYTAEGLAIFLGQRGYDVRSIALTSPEPAPPERAVAGPQPDSRPAPPATPAAEPQTATLTAPVAVPDVTGSDAVSGRNLAQAMQNALARSGVKLAKAPDAGSLKVVGNVSVGHSKAGKRPVSVVWKVLDRQDQLVGDVKQNNEVPAGMLENGWSPIAKLVADAAAGGVLDLLVRAR